MVFKEICTKATDHIYAVERLISRCHSFEQLLEFRKNKEISQNIVLHQIKYLSN